MNVEDANIFSSRFNQETFEGFVNGRKPTQVVCNHDARARDPTQSNTYPILTQNVDANLPARLEKTTRDLPANHPHPKKDM